MCMVEERFQVTPHMPRLPQVVGHVGIDPVQQSIGAAQLPGEAAARVGSEVADIGQQMAEKQIQLQKLNDYTALSSQAGLAIDAAVTNELQNPDYRSAPERVSAAISKISSDTLKEIKDPEVAAQLNQYLTRSAETNIINARHFTNQSEINNGRSLFDASLDASRTRLAGMSGLEYAQELSHQKGLSDAAVSVGLFSPEQMQEKMQGYHAGVAEDNAGINGLVDPIGTVNELVSGDAYDALNPSQRLAKAQQILTQTDKRKEQADKARLDSMDQDITDLTLIGRSGKLTSDQITGLVNKYRQPGEKPVAAEQVRLLSEYVNHPPLEPPSNPVDLANATRSVVSLNPNATPNDLWELYQLHQKDPSRGIDFKDYDKLSGQLDVGTRRNQDQARTLENQQLEHNAKIISDEYGGDPAIHAAAITALYAGQTLDQIHKQFDEQIKGSIGTFRGARNSYVNALQQQGVWNDSLHLATRLEGGGNPYDESVTIKAREFLETAKKANRDLGTADSSVPQGKIFLYKGHPVMSVSGRIIAVE